jgi:type VI secretion system protein ImpM
MAKENHEGGPRDGTGKTDTGTGTETTTETSSGAASPPGETTGDAPGDEAGTGPEDAAQDAPRPETGPEPEPASEGVEDTLPADDTQTTEPAPPGDTGERPEKAPEGAPDANAGADSSADAGADSEADLNTDPASADPPAQPPAPAKDDPWTAADDARDNTGPEPEPERKPEATPAPEPVSASAPAPDEPAQPCAAGLFGKLPARGDFISRSIDRDLLRPLEDWLLPLVQTARGLLGDGWSAAWHRAPAWRFWIGPDILQGDWKRNMRSHDRPGAVTGVLLPSADRQGRHFPLVLVLADDHARLMPPPVLSPPDRHWYAHCDHLLDAARAGRDLAQVEAELSTLRAPRLPEGAADMGPLLAQKSLWGQGGGQGGMHEGGDVWTDIRMSDHHLAAACRSYWWTEAPGRAESAPPPISVISLAGLPDAETFAFMLTDAIPQPQEPDPT